MHLLNSCQTRNSTRSQPQLNITSVRFDTKMTLHTPPTTSKPHVSSISAGTSRIDSNCNSNKTEVESVQLGNTYFADMDKCSEDKCCDDSCNLLYMFPGPFVYSLIQIGPVWAEILLIWTNVAWTNVVVTVVICCICPQDPLLTVWSKLGQ